MRQRSSGAALLAGLAVAIVVALPAAAYTILRQSDVNGNGRADTWLIDDNLDGLLDRLVTDSNEDGYLDGWVSYDSFGRAHTMWADLNLNGRYEMAVQPVYGSNGATVGQYWWSDANEDGRHENLYWDGQMDGIYEQVMIDTNFDGFADTWRQSVAPANPNAPYMPAHNVATHNMIDIFHRAGRCVFYCGY